MLEMDQNLEQRDLGKNTGIEIPIRETEGRENKKKMQPVRFDILSSKPFEETFENPQWRKVKQMQPV